MENLIEKYKDKKAQIAGNILSLEDLRKGYTFLEYQPIDKIELLESQADLYDALIGLAQAMLKIQK